MVVDDDADIANLIGEVLRDSGPGFASRTRFITVCLTNPYDASPASPAQPSAQRSPVLQA